jgi:hypothetical protein
MRVSDDMEVRPGLTLAVLLTDLLLDIFVGWGGSLSSLYPNFVK